MKRLLDTHVWFWALESWLRRGMQALDLLQERGHLARKVYGYI